MVTPAQSERATSQSVHVNITDTDKTQTRATTIRCRRRLRVPHLLNAFIVVLGKLIIFLLIHVALRSLTTIYFIM